MRLFHYYKKLGAISFTVLGLKYYIFVIIENYIKFQKLLTSCLAIFEECKQVGNLISNMEQYALQFAQIWLEIIGSYATSASETYSNVNFLF